MKRAIGLTICLVLCAHFAAQSARSELITVAFTGRITDLYDPYSAFWGIDGWPGVGGPITGSFTYDTSAPDLNPLDNQTEYQYYQGPSGISLRVGEVVFQPDLTNVDFHVGIIDNPGSVEDVFSLRSSNNTPLAHDVLVKEISMHFAGTYAEHLISGEMPTQPQTPRPLGPGVFFDIDGDKTASRYFDTGGTLDNLWLVPEPATLLMLGGGALLLRRRSPRKRRRRTIP